MTWKRLCFICVVVLLASGLAFAGGQKEAPSPEQEAAETETETQEWASGEGIGQWASVSEFEEQTGRTIDSYSQAPELDERVSAGELPSVADRLPSDPAVVEPIPEVGTYGGNLDHATKSPTSSHINYRFGYEPLVRWARDSKTIVPGLAKSYEVSDDATRYTFHLREGMKWSDGNDFTSEDIMFWYEDVILNEELTPSAPAWLTAGGEVVDVEAPDDYTVRFTFAEPNGLFLRQLAFRHDIYIPKHYLEQFHPEYADSETLEEMVNDQDYDSWTQLFNAKRGRYDRPEVPVLTAWHVTDVNSQRVLLERNPYYWKVDTQGNQLPYIDTRRVRLMGDNQVITLAAVEGDFDIQPAFLQLQSYPVLAENADQSGYELYQWGNNANVEMYNTDALEYDPERANSLLDEIGLEWDANQEFRLGPNGEELTFVMDILPGQFTMELYELVKSYFAEIGINVALRERDGNLWRQRVWNYQTEISAYNQIIRPNQNTQDPVVRELLQNQDFRTALSLSINRQEIVESLYYGLGATDEHRVQIAWQTGPNFQVPISKFTYWAPAWGRWYATNGQEGEEPPEEIKELQGLLEQMQQTADLEEQEELANEILRRDMENLYTINTVNVPTVVLVGDNMHNVQTGLGRFSWRIMTPGYLNPEQWYLEE